MAALPYRRLAGFYFFYFAWVGAFAPFFTLYLQSVGIGASEIGVLMALPALARIFAPYLWGWLADTGVGHARLVRVTAAASLVCYLGVFAGHSFTWLFAVLLLASFFWTAALPLVEATTLAHVGENPGRYGPVRMWGSLGFMAAVIGVGHALDWIAVDNLLWIIAVLLAGTLVYSWRIPEAAMETHTTDALSIWHILKRPEVTALIAACALMAVAHGPYYTFYSIHLVEHGYSKSLTGCLWALGVICEIAIFLWMSRLYSAFTPRQILIASFALAALRFLIIGWGVDSLVLLLLAQSLHAASFGSFHAAAIGVVHQHFRGRHQARGQVIYGSLTFGVGGVLGPLASGYLWDHAGAALTFSAGSACALIGMLLIVWKLTPGPRNP